MCVCTLVHLGVSVCVCVCACVIGDFKEQWKLRECESWCALDPGLQWKEETPSIKCVLSVGERGRERERERERVLVEKAGF